MLFRSTRLLAAKWFNWNCREIFTCPPVTSNQDGPFIITLLHSEAVTPYLVAIKSFFKHGVSGDVVILNDGSLTDDDQKNLRLHIKNCTIKEIRDYQDSSLPSGGCWERLNLVSKLANKKYTIQLDSDTLSVASLTEVQLAVSQNIPFCMPGQEDARYDTIESFTPIWEQRRGNSVQTLAELELLNANERWPMYAQGCAAFAGYPKGSFSTDDAIEIHEHFSSKLGSAWSQWGSEQFTANLLVAQIKGFEMLTHPEYASFWPGLMTEIDRCSFIHFYGTHRYHKGQYVKFGRAVSRTLRL